MHISKACLAALGAAAAALLAQPAAAAGSSTGTFQVIARVPVACWVHSNSGSVSTDGSGGGGSGSVVEACNSPGGFQVTASYRQLDTGEHALFRYGASDIDLPHSGEALLRTSNMAQINTVAYAFEQTQLEQPLILALSIVPN